MKLNRIDSFLTLCDSINDSKSYASFLPTSDIWNNERIKLYDGGIVSGLFKENNYYFLSLLDKNCDHNKLRVLLKKHKDKMEKSELSILAKQYGMATVSEPHEPLVEWIADYNYLLAFPLCNSKDDVLEYPKPEYLLTYVYLYLSYLEHSQTRRSFDRSGIDEIFRPTLGKDSDFKKWGLLKIDKDRELFSNDNPVRIYDSKLNKTVFVHIPPSIAVLFEELKRNNKIGEISFLGKSNFIFDGENHRSILMESIERGKQFTFHLNTLPCVTKLFSKSYFNDCLWIVLDSENLTFEEMCEDFYVEDETIVTQVIHIQYKDNLITHLDHEYIYYTIQEYEQRLNNPYIKGKAKKRIKTFKINNSTIPFDYPCKVYSSSNEIDIPFIYFVLDNYFNHKELVEEYFEHIL